MEILSFLANLIPTVGFPVVCVIAMGIFIYRIYKHLNEQNESMMKSMQTRCAEREEKLLAEIKENREINATAIETIAKYVDRLDDIQTDVSEIKIDIIRLNERLK